MRKKTKNFIVVGLLVAKGAIAAPVPPLALDGTQPLVQLTLQTVWRQTLEAPLMDAVFDEVDMTALIANETTHGNPGANENCQNPDQKVWLGVNLSTKKPDSEGVKVIRVARDTPAWKAHIYWGDVIMAISGQRVRNLDEVKGILQSYHPGDMVQVEIDRFGVRKLLSVTLAFPIQAQLMDLKATRNVSEVIFDAWVPPRVTVPQPIQIGLLIHADPTGSIDHTFVTGTVERSDQSSVPLTLSFEGSGRYSAMYQDYPVDGTYRVMVRVTHTSDGVFPAFERKKVMDVKVCFAPVTTLSFGSPTALDARGMRWVTPTSAVSRSVTGRRPPFRTQYQVDGGVLLTYTAPFTLTLDVNGHEKIPLYGARKSPLYQEEKS